MNISERFSGCILAGAIGDAFGSAYENQPKDDENITIFYPFGKPETVEPEWQITDDTQLTIATCETIIENKNLKAEYFANKFLEYFKRNKIRGIGASTLKAMRELDVGGHWALVGRKGEYAAGNGAAMRIAPLSFESNISRSLIKDVCNITHQNDEAYVGALSITIAINSILDNTWTGKENLLEIIINEIPDTRVRDRLIEINNMNCDLSKIGSLGNDGYVVNSVPLSIAFASKVKEIGLTEMFNQIIAIGGDTDTNCSMAGQIAGTLIGSSKIPKKLVQNLMKLHEYSWIISTIDKYKGSKDWV